MTYDQHLIILSFEVDILLDNLSLYLHVELSSPLHPIGMIRCASSINILTLEFILLMNSLASAYSIVAHLKRQGMLVPVFATSIVHLLLLSVGNATIIPKILIHHRIIWILLEWVGIRQTLFYKVKYLQRSKVLE